MTKRLPSTGKDRGLANGIVGFVAIIIVAAILYTLLGAPADVIFSTASSQTDSAQAQSVIDERRQIWTLVLYFALFLASLFILARAVFESRRPG